MSNWTADQQWEKEWHGHCANSLGEELKQIMYAEKMGIKFIPNEKTAYNIDLKNKSILDIGGGPYSLLLKSNNFSKAVVADPCVYPDWVYARYKELGIESVIEQGEKINIDYVFDEVWIYNVLQHVFSPEEVIIKAKKHSKIIRIFEWLEVGVHPGHPHNLKENLLNEWLNGFGKVEPYGGFFCYYGIFKGDNYE